MVTNQPKVLKEMIDIKNILIKRQETVAAAESLTAGHVQTMMSAVSGASHFFQGGVTTYQLENKVQLLDVDLSHGASVNCVSARIASAMAKQVRHLFCSHWGIATTGYAEACGEHTHPYAYIAIFYGEQQQYCGKHIVKGLERIETQRAIAQGVIGALHQCLREIQ